MAKYILKATIHLTNNKSKKLPDLLSDLLNSAKNVQMPHHYPSFPRPQYNLS